MQGRFYEAEATDIDPKARTVTAHFPEDAGLDHAAFKIEYDILVLGASCRACRVRLASRLK